MNSFIEALFTKYHIRKTRAQKAGFVEYMKSVSLKYGFSYRIENAPFGSKNIVIGTPERAKVVYTAHYDTSAVSPVPNIITPKNILLYILYQLFVTLTLLLPALAVGYGTYGLLSLTAIGGGMARIISLVLGWAALIFATVLLVAGPANKATANDNTSGVATVISIMERLTAEQRNKVAFILFDLEEAGLIGSSAFAARHKKDMEARLVINFDCVSEGDDILFWLRRRANGYKTRIEEAFGSDGHFRVEVADRGIFCPSDNLSFPMGVAVTAFKRTRGGLLYLTKIHTKRDTVFSEKNIEFLAEGAVKLIEML